VLAECQVILRVPTNIIFDIVPNPNGGTGISAGGFGHPTCHQHIGIWHVAARTAVASMCSPVRADVSAYRILGCAEAAENSALHTALSRRTAALGRVPKYNEKGFRDL
jgi:hypothetical protein